MKTYKGKCNRCKESGKTFYGLNKVCSECQLKQARKRGRIKSNEFIKINGEEIF